MTTARAIAEALGGFPSGSWWRCRCPAHNSTGPTLALLDGSHGLIVHCHAGCRRADILAAIGRLGLRREPEAVDPVEASRRREADGRRRCQRIAAALDLWRNETTVPAHTVVERYWVNRGLGAIPIPPTIRASGSWLRHPEGGSRPAMIALVEHVEHGLCAIHRTFLAIDGGSKASFRSPRLALGPIGGAAVRLAEAREDVPLVIAEGIENAASVMSATRLPAWAAISAGGIERLVLPPLPLAATVFIAADHDANGRGERAARNAAERWLAEGRRVRIAMPTEPGDWNDELIGGDRRHVG